MKTVCLNFVGGLICLFFSLLVFSNTYARSAPLERSGECSITSKHYTVSVAIEQVGHRVVIEPKTMLYLIGKNDMTLYYLQGETPNHLLCTSSKCLQIWPIFYSKNIFTPKFLKSKDFTVFVRNDGRKQLAYNNHPLYYFAGDKKPGDTLGNNLKTSVGIWHIIIINND